MCGSANVCTPSPAEQSRAAAKVSGALLLGRVQLIEMMFDGESIDYIAIQEGRGKATETRAGLHYDMFSTAADSLGLFGVQAWAHKRTKFKVCTIGNVSPRIMYVSGIDGRYGSKTIIVSAHAPTEAAALPDKEAFWSAILEVCRGLREKV